MKTTYEQAAELLDVLHRAQGKELMTATQRADKMHVLKALHRQRSEPVAGKQREQAEALLANMKKGV